MNNKTKLLFYVSEDWYFVSHRLALGEAALKRGFEVVVVTNCGEASKKIREAGIQTIHFETDRRGMNPFVLLREIYRLARIYRHLKPDLVHHVALRPVITGGLAAKCAGIRRVVSAITGLGFLFATEGRAPQVRKILQRLLPKILRPGEVIIQNRDDRDWLCSCGSVDQDICLIPGAGIDVRDFSPAQTDNHPPIVMFAARLLWDKGIGEFVAAARHLHGKKLRFVIVGKPDMHNPASITKDQLASWTDAGIIEYWGHSEHMAETLAKADIVCLPSYREGLPKVLLEAMACGRACITTDAPGCREAVRHGDNGLLIPIKDSGALAEAIMQLAGNPAERSRMGSRGRERAMTEFSQEIIIEVTMQVYEKLLAS